MPNIAIAPTATVSSTAVLGRSFRHLLNGLKPPQYGEVRVEDNAYIGEFCVIGCDVWLGSGTIVDDFSKLEPGVRIGRRNLLIYGSQICCDVTCGDDNVIGGFVGESTSIGSNCRIFGRIVHRQEDPIKPWDDEASAEGAPTIADNCFIGFGATIIGAVELAPFSYVAAGAIVSRSVPSRTVVIGTNKHVPISEWKGSLKASPFFLERN